MELQSNDVLQQWLVKTISSVTKHFQEDSCSLSASYTVNCIAIKDDLIFPNRLGFQNYAQLNMSKHGYAAFMIGFHELKMFWLLAWSSNQMIYQVKPDCNIAVRNEPHPNSYKELMSIFFERLLWILDVLHKVELQIKTL